jgi:hypothetical protein
MAVDVDLTANVERARRVGRCHEELGLALGAQQDVGARAWARHDRMSDNTRALQLRQRGKNPEYGSDYRDRIIGPGLSRPDYEAGLSMPGYRGRIIEEERRSRRDARGERTSADDGRRDAIRYNTDLLVVKVLATAPRGSRAEVSRFDRRQRDGFNFTRVHDHDRRRADHVLPMVKATCRAFLSMRSTSVATTVRRLFGIRRTQFYKSFLSNISPALRLHQRLRRNAGSIERKD